MFHNMRIAVVNKRVYYRICNRAETHTKNVYMDCKRARSLFGDTPGHIARDPFRADMPTQTHTRRRLRWNCKRET